MELLIVLLVLIVGGVVGIGALALVLAIGSKAKDEKREAAAAQVKSRPSR